MTRPAAKKASAAAKKSPEKYRNLRVRVTGFSDYFVNLTEDIQNSIIARTSPKE